MPIQKKGVEQSATDQTTKEDIENVGPQRDASPEVPAGVGKEDVHVVEPLKSGTAKGLDDAVDDIHSVRTERTTHTPSGSAPGSVSGREN